MSIADIVAKLKSLQHSTALKWGDGGVGGEGRGEGEGGNVY